MNNKKLFKGALVLFASILMAVSCSSNSNPGDDGKGGSSSSGNGDKTTTITDKDVLDWVKALGDVKGDNGGSIKYQFGNANGVTISNPKVTLSPDADTGVKKVDTLANLTTAVTSNSKNKVLTGSDTKWKTSAPNTSENGIVEITLTPAKGYKLPSGSTITLEITLKPGTSSGQWS